MATKLQSAGPLAAIDMAVDPAAATRWRNLFLAGDWTRTGLPATIEGALRSGETAARLAIHARTR